MAIVAPPPELMGVTASQLLEAAAVLGLPASAVTTTSDGPLGLGFLVPDAVWEAWAARGLEARAPKAQPEPEPEPEPEAEAAPRPRRGVSKSKPVTEEPEV